MKIHLLLISVLQDDLEIRSHLCSAHTTWTLGQLVSNPFRRIEVKTQEVVKVCDKCKWDYELQSRA